MNTLSRTCRLTLLAAAALLLASCNWNIGERIRSGSAVHVGADVFNPIGGKRYRDPADANDRWTYASLPELTYRTTPKLVEGDLKGNFVSYAENVRLTGRTVLVRYRFHDAYHVSLEKVAALPPGAVLRGAMDRMEARARRARLTKSNRPNHRINVYGDLPGTEATRGTPGAQLAAAPFDFVLDPVLCLVTTPIYAAGIGLTYGTRAMCLKGESWVAQQQQTED